MRRPSSIDRAKQKERIESARRMTPAERLEVCVKLSKLVEEIHRSGKGMREAAPNSRP